MTNSADTTRPQPVYTYPAHTRAAATKLAGRSAAPAKLTKDELQAVAADMGALQDQARKLTKAALLAALLPGAEAVVATTQAEDSAASQQWYRDRWPAQNAKAVAELEADMAAWAAKFLLDPAYELGWAQLQFERAAMLQLRKAVASDLAKAPPADYPTPASAVQALVPRLQADLMRKAATLPGSSSSTSNLMEACERKALADLLDNLRWACYTVPAFGTQACYTVPAFGTQAG